MREKIKYYLKQKIGTECNLNDNEDIFEQGMVNSMFALQLIMYLEKEFNIKIDNEDLVLSNFNTIDNIHEFVLFKQGN